MWKIFGSGLLLTALTTACPSPAEAQLCRHVLGSCCRTCTLPPSTCTCTTFQPVVETRFRQENIVTYQDVTRVGVRQETQIENVPITTFDQVTVDEGGYQMVWVPKPVTKTVARTTIQPRLSQRAVPFAYQQRVPQIATRLVPQQTVRLAPVQTQVVLNGMPTIITPTVAIQPVVPVISSLPVAAPSVASVPAISADPAQWATVPSRSSELRNARSETAYDGPSVELQSPIVPDPLPLPESGFEDSVKAPSAARVWQSSQRTLPARW